MVSDTLHVFVAMNAHPKTGVLIRAAAKKAQEMGCGWTCIHVETPRDETLGREASERLMRYITFVEELGGTVCRVGASSAAEGIISVIAQAIEAGMIVHTVIIGKTQKDRFWQTWRASTAERIARYLRESTTSVQIIPLSGKLDKPHWTARLRSIRVRLMELCMSVFYVGFALILALVLPLLFPSAPWAVKHMTAFFLVAVMFCASRHGVLTGIASAILSYVAMSFVFVKPYFSFATGENPPTLTLIIFIAAGAIISLHGAYSRSSMATASRRERRSQALHRLYRSASEATTQREAIEIMQKELCELLQMDVVFFMPEPHAPKRLSTHFPESIECDERALASLQASWEELRTAGMSAPLMPHPLWRFEPMITPDSDVGVLAVKVPLHMHLDTSFGRLLHSIADQVAHILERLELTQLMSESHIREEREKLRAMLLSSVSHDLKTPLASIIGSLSIYKKMLNAGRLNNETAQELMDTALDESQRLDSFITNILDMTKIESGDITFKQEWADPAEMVASVRKRLKLKLRHHELVERHDGEPFHLRCDPMMTEQVLQNILDNAAKYAPEGTLIELSYRYDDGCVFTIRDCGDGIPEEKFEAVFDKYERLRKKDSKVAGTGLGLAICRAIVEEQGGHISVANHPEGGAMFTVFFPDAKLLSELTEDLVKAAL